MHEGLYSKIREGIGAIADRNNGTINIDQICSVAAGVASDTVAYFERRAAALEDDKKALEAEMHRVTGFLARAHVSMDKATNARFAELSEHKAAEFLSIDMAKLARFREDGGGPDFTRHHSLHASWITYSRADLKAWRARHKNALAPSL